ncbi:MAG: hypothetical protein ACRDZ0_09975 [Acidimicrobiales bacterium]
MTAPPTGRYVSDTAADAERRRLEAQAQLWDPFTFRMLAATGVPALLPVIVQMREAMVASGSAVDGDRRQDPVVAGT